MKGKMKEKKSKGNGALLIAAVLMSLTAAGLKAGLKGDALRADVLPKLRASHPDYVTTLAGPLREVTLMEQELDGTKRLPQPVP